MKCRNRDKNSVRCYGKINTEIIIPVLKRRITLPASPCNECGLLHFLHNGKIAIDPNRGRVFHSNNNLAKKEKEKPKKGIHFSKEFGRHVYG
ncbi:MAG TPA: hypothetical protein PKA60_00325 [Candidatus Paceibacterota bacterium]|nr:hypothetical protein [Candidatus Paceibacterota bacterium]